MAEDAVRKQRVMKYIVFYPFVMIVISVGINLYLGVAPAVVALPAMPIITALTIAMVLLLATHSLLMTSTELTRLFFGMHVSPEEWEASGQTPDKVAKSGWAELARNQNAHRDLTENTVQFVLAAILVSILSPVEFTAQVWIIAFAIGRFAHAFFYLAGKDSARGVAMSISLVSLYGLASYACLSLVK